MADIIEAEGLVKHYGEVVALDGLDIRVPEGAILAMLGPNGAGKTTAVSILTTLLKPDDGTARVAGVDVLDEPAEVRSLIGLSGQNAAVDEHLTGFENLYMIGRLYHIAKPDSRKRARELLDQFDLADAADRPVKTYSGGMRRRLDLAGALVARSPVLFLDEPTTGLDPRSRTELWGSIRDLVSGGSTLLLTTQYLEEADLLADDIMVIDHGRAIAQGTADELKDMYGGDRIEATVADPEHLGSAEAILTEFAEGEIQHDERLPKLIVPITGGAPTLTRALRALDGGAIVLRDVQLRRPSLDDVFLAITGHHADDEELVEEEVS